MKTRTVWSAFWLLAVLASLSLVRCGCKEYPECDTDTECVEYGRGTPYCVDNMCVECRDGSNCAACSECRNGACQAFQCCDDSACTRAQICESHRCVTGCRDDAQCAEVDPAVPYCVSNRCVACRSDADCTSPLTCVDGACVDQTECGNHTFETVYFDFDESVIRRDQEANLAHNAACMTQFPEENITIEGHCDERGTDAYNMALGNRRARAARDYMKDTGGVDNDRMNTISYGESRPADPGHTESAWSRNRRAEIVWR